MSTGQGDMVNTNTNMFLDKSQKSNFARISFLTNKFKPCTGHKARYAAHLLICSGSRHASRCLKQKVQSGHAICKLTNSSKHENVKTINKPPIKSKCGGGKAKATSKGKGGRGPAGGNYKTLTFSAVLCTSASLRVYGFLQVQLRLATAPPLQLTFLSKPAFLPNLSSKGRE